MSLRNAPNSQIDDIATRLGFDSFRPHQRQAIEALLDGRDVMAVVPTGGGKSAIYLSGAELLDGVTVVVTPLLALRDDQMHAIERAGLSTARAIDGSTSDGDRSAVLEEFRSGAAEYLFVTPETLMSDSVQTALDELSVSLLVVDEAHCIVTWGQTYRSDYVLLGDARRRMGDPLTVALTASADPRMRQDIARALDLDDPLVITDELERDNIVLSVESAPTKEAATERLVKQLLDDSRKALVYVATRKLTEAIAAELAAGGRTAWAYHGGLDAGAKEDVLSGFRCSADAVVVATTAFGMGIDIGDIAQVAHLDMPESLLSYYQEVGRSGRDGQPATGTVYVSLRSRSRRAFASGVRSIEVEECAQVYRAIEHGAASRRAVVAAVPFGAVKVARAIDVLDRAGAISSRPQLRIAGTIDQSTVERECDALEEFDRSQLQAVERYRSTRACRWSQILASLGDALDRCGHCDHCLESTSTDGRPDVSVLVGVTVDHQDFGTGIVTAERDGLLDISFDAAGPKTLQRSWCEEAGMLPKSAAA